MNKDVRQRRALVEEDSPRLSMTRQCELLEIHRSGLYYQPRGESELNLRLMREIDEEFMRHPWLGAERMKTYLNKDLGYQVNIKRIRRLYRLMDLRAIGPRPDTSKPAKGHKVYPYLLRELKVNGPDHVWSMDITYIPVQGGFLYLCAIIDLYSRCVVGWSLSNTMTAQWCTDVVRQAVAQHGTPEILNTDQGSQFTADVFTRYVTEHAGIRLSMDGKGRAIDNVFIERFWRSLKYEHVYLRPSSDGVECYRGISEYMDYYNHERRHTSVGGIPPSHVYRPEMKAAA